MGARIHVVVGPMFAGKSMWLIQRWDELGLYSKTQNRFVVVPRKDARNVGVVAARLANKTVPADAVVDTLTEVVGRVVDAKCSAVFVDEGHFFPDLAAAARRLREEGVDVYVAAIDGSYDVEVFPQIAALLPIADTFVKMNAMCPIHEQPAWGTRLLVKPPSASSHDILVGDTETYAPRCTLCDRKPL